MRIEFSGLKMIIARLALVLAAIAAVGSGSATFAQSMVPPSIPEEGAWSTIAGPYVTEYYGSADAACRRQKEVYNAAAEYDGTGRADFDDNWCAWHRPPWMNPGTLPSIVTFVCPAGTTKTWKHTCNKPDEILPECPSCSPSRSPSESPSPDKGKPISLATGSETQTETDYVSADGLLSVVRHYRSIQRGQINTADHELPGFGWSWHGIVPGRIIISGTNEEVAEYHAANGGIEFLNASTSNLSSFDYAAQGVSRIKLSAVGTPGVDRIAFFKDGASVASGAAEMRLEFGNGEYILFRRSDVYRYDTHFRYLVPIEHGFPGGYKQVFDYPDTGEYPSKITDSFGREIVIHWENADSHVKVISSLDLPDGTTLEYDYSRPTGPVYFSGGGFASAFAMGGGGGGGGGAAVIVSTPSYYEGNSADRLISARHADASDATIWSREYLYEKLGYPYALTGFKNSAGERLATIGYGLHGRATSTELAGGFNKYTIDYLQDHPSLPLQNYRRDVTGPLGQEEVYHFFRNTSAPKGMRSILTQVDRLASATVPAASETFSYANVNGYDFMLSGYEDPKGNALGYTVDTANRRPTAVVKAQGESEERTTDLTWHSQFDLPMTEEREGLKVDYTYDASGKMLTRTETDTTTHNVPYSTNGQNRTWTYDWSSEGRLLSVNGPLADDGMGHDDIVSYTYDVNGNRLTATNPLGQVTTFAGHDGNGRPATKTDENGVVTAFTYDGRGRVTTITIKHPNNPSLDALTTVEYDEEGRITGITRPATAKIFFDYNLAGLLTSMRSADGERIDYEHDAMGNVTKATVKRTNGSASAMTTRTYDSLGRLLSEALGPRRIARWAYDANGNATTVTNPMNNATTHAFDALDRLISTVAPDGGTSAQIYDGSDNLTDFTDPILVTTQFTYNGFGDVIREVSPDRGTNTYWYDASGALTQSSDGRGQVISYTRDYAGRVTQRVPTGLSAQAVTYTLDSGGLSGSYDVGRIGQILDASGATRFKYDHRGNMLIKQQAIGSSSTAQLVYEYDLADRVTQITYPSGRIVQYGYDGKGRVNLVQTKANSGVGSWTVIADSFSYEPFGSVKGMALGNGLSIAIDWGNDGRLASRRLYQTSGGTNFSHLSYSYDPNDNINAIINELDSAGSVYYGYDVNDRLTQTSVPGSGTSSSETYSYTSGTNRLASISDGTNTRSISYDGRGNTSAESRPGSISASTGYDGYGRLTDYDRTDIGTLDFAYNGLNDRVAMTSGAGTRRFVYDGDGRVLGEYGASASDVKAEFIWLAPQVGSSSQFGGDDGADGYAPLAVATPNSGGTVVLSWVYGNHLGVPISITDASGAAAATPNDYLAPGFPGQSKVLADLYYNRYRDFDPTTGRYIQADPIGLRGGSNNYAYASGNPTRYTDPLGLQVVIPIPTRGPPPIGFPGGADADANNNGAIDWDETQVSRIEDFVGECLEYIRGKPDPCAKILANIRRIVGEMKWRLEEMKRDRRQLYDYAYDTPNPAMTKSTTTWVGHQAQFDRLKKKLREWIRAADKNKCPVSAEERMYSWMPTPIRPYWRK